MFETMMTGKDFWRGFDSFFDTPSKHGVTKINKDENLIEIKYAVPGFTKDEITITTRDEYLTVTLKTNKETKSLYVVDIKESWNCAGFNLNEVKVDLTDGILTISLKKLEDTTPKMRKIEF